jgi:hypothetical protein
VINKRLFSLILFSLIISLFNPVIPIYSHGYKYNKNINATVDNGQATINSPFNHSGGYEGINATFQINYSESSSIKPKVCFPNNGGIIDNNTSHYSYTGKNIITYTIFIDYNEMPTITDMKFGLNTTGDEKLNDCFGFTGDEGTYPIYTAYPIPILINNTPKFNYINKTTNITINGSGFFNQTNSKLKVFFNNKQIAFKYINDNQLTFMAPASTVVKKNISIMVQNVAGESNFMYFDYINNPPFPPNPPIIPPKPSQLLDGGKPYTLAAYIAIKKSNVVKIPLTVYSHSGKKYPVSWKITVSKNNKKYIKASGLPKKFNTNTIKYLKMKGLKDSKNKKKKVKISADFGYGWKSRTLNIFVTKNKKLQKSKVKVSFRKNKKTIRKNEFTYIIITKKSKKIQYIHPTWKYNKKYINIDKLGRISRKKKSKKPIVIKVKWQRKWYKLKLKVK